MELLITQMHLFTEVWKLNYLVSYLLTYSIQHSPKEADQIAASQEIPHILWNPKVLLQHSQMPATCPYPEPARFRP